jgi:hypothetical protein
MIILNDINEFRRTKILEYEYLVSINLERSLIGEVLKSFSIQIVLNNIENESLILRCSNATDIKFKELEGTMSMVLDVEDISDYQLEGVRYRIRELEYNTFAFDCSDFFIEFK